MAQAQVVQVRAQVQAQAQAFSGAPAAVGAPKKPKHAMDKKQVSLAELESLLAAATSDKAYPNKALAAAMLKNAQKLAGEPSKYMLHFSVCTAAKSVLECEEKVVSNDFARFHFHLKGTCDNSNPAFDDLNSDVISAISIVAKHHIDCVAKLSFAPCLHACLLAFLTA